MMRSLAPWVVVLAAAMLLAPLAAEAREDADLSITHTVSPSPATETAALTYSMNIFNNGPAVVATGVTVTDTLPAGLTFGSATFTLRGGVSTPCTGTGTTTINCDIGNLTLGGGAAVVIVVTPQGPGELSNTATVHANEADPDPTNNTATAVTTVVPRASSPALLDPHLALSTVVSGLTEPTGLAFLGPNDLLVTEKSTGRVQRVMDGVIQGPVLTLPVNVASERGLLGIALHPRFAANGLVYLFWTCRGPAAGSECEDGPPSGDIARVPLLGNRVDRFVWNGARLTFDSPLIQLRAFQADADQNGIFNQPLRGNHDGGRLLFGPDGKLYILIGDTGRRGWLQNIRTGTLPNRRDDQFGGPKPDNAHLTGVILRLNDDGSTPDDNPFFDAGATLGGEVGANLQKVFAYGIRNSFGMAFDPLSGHLWTEENGDDSFSEINRVEAGFNGGWVQICGPVERVAEFEETEAGPRYFGLQQVRWPPTRIAQTPEKALARLFMLPGAHFTDPQLSWKFEVAPAGMGFVHSRRLGPEYAGDLIMGAARDFLLGGQLWRFKLSDDRRDLVFSDARLADRVADNLDKFDLTESESLLFGTGFGISTDIVTGPNGHLFVLSLSQGAIYELSRGAP